MTRTHTQPVELTLQGLRDDDRRELLTLARTVIEQALHTGQRQLPEDGSLPPRLQELGASFVSLRRGDDLLGSVGSLEPQQSLGVDVSQHALAAALDDPRVPAIGTADLSSMVVEISILGALAASAALSVSQLALSLRPAVDGVAVRTGGGSATFLPSVWTNVRDADDFLALLWRKAGLAVGDWPTDVRVWTYRAETFCDA